MPLPCVVSPGEFASVVNPDLKMSLIASRSRSLAAAVSPLLAGFMLGLSSFGWPLIVAGATKAIYDLALLVMFRTVRPPEEAQSTSNR